MYVRLIVVLVLLCVYVIAHEVGTIQEQVNALNEQISQLQEQKASLIASMDGCDNHYGDETCTGEVPLSAATPSYETLKWNTTEDMDELGLRFHNKLPECKGGPMSITSIRISRRNPHKQHVVQLPMGVRLQSVVTLIVLGCGNRIMLYNIPKEEDPIGKLEYSFTLPDDANAVSLSTTHVRNAMPRYVFVGTDKGTGLLYSLSSWVETIYNDDDEIIKHTVMLNAHYEAIIQSFPKRIDSFYNERGSNYDEDMAVYEENSISIITNLALYQRNRYAAVIIGYGDGMVRMFTRNGTLKFQVRTGLSSIKSMAFSSATPAVQKIAFANEQGIGTIRITPDVKSIELYCKVSNFSTGVASLGWDISSPSKLYLVTIEGELVLISSLKRNQEYCEPKYRKIVESGSSLYISPANGYIFITSSSYLYIYNASTPSLQTYPELIAKRKVFSNNNNNNNNKEQINDKTKPILIDNTLDMMKEGWLSMMDISTGNIIGFQSYYIINEEDYTGWTSFRVPVFLIGIFVVVLYNVFKKTQRNSNIGMNMNPEEFMRSFKEFESRGSRRGNMGDMNMGDMRMRNNNVNTDYSMKSTTTSFDAKYNVKY